MFEKFRQNPNKYAFCFENFGKNHFTIDNRVFRVFVEIPIGKILALFDVFSATLEGGSGSGLWEK